MNVVTKYIGDSPVTVIEYPPNGASHELQEHITNLLHRRVMEDGRVTLAELGYLHMNTLTYDSETGNLDLRVYFDAHRAMKMVQSSTSMGGRLMPVNELRMFENYLYVGELDRAYTLETIVAPGGKFIEDELGKPSLKMKDDAKIVELETLALHCNLAMTLAAVHNVSLMDPGFGVRCKALGKGSKKSEKSIIAMAAREVPVAVTMTATNGADPYDPDEAVPYLTMMASRSAKAEDDREKLVSKVKDTAKKNKKKSKNEGHSSAFLKYS